MTHPLPFVLSATDQGAMIVSRLDWCRVGSTDQAYGVGASLLNQGSYDPEEIAVLIAVLHARRKARGDGVVVVDCGANIGVHTTCFARVMQGWGSVIAIEAQERVFYALAGNIALGNFFNARAIWAAVGDKFGVLNIPEPDYLRPASLGSFALLRPADGGDTGQEIDYSRDTATVRGMTIDSLVLQRCDLIKIDVEGMEPAVLRGASETIAHCRPAVFVETMKGDRDAILTEFPDGYEFNDMSNGVLGLPKYAWMVAHGWRDAPSIVVDSETVAAFEEIHGGKFARHDP
jgi:FkbM family methyltransferase